MNWGKWIAATFVLFAGFISVLVVVCMREEVSLVSAKYYEEDLHYQQQFDQVSNANALNTRPQVSIQQQIILLSYTHFSKMEEGTLTLMRPSNAALDHVFKLATQTDTLQQFVLKDIAKGLYKVRVQWKQEGKEFRIDRTLVI